MHIVGLKPVGVLREGFCVLMKDGKWKEGSKPELTVAFLAV